MNPNHKPWQPLPASEWNRDAAKHLASRLGFSLHPASVNRISELGPASAVADCLGEPQPMPEPEPLADMRTAEDGQDLRGMDETERRAQRKERQRLARESYAEYALSWYAFARTPKNAPQEKLVAFFQNVWVVSFQGVKSVPALFDFQQTIRSRLAGSYPEMCHALSRSPAMARYLDLSKNRKGAPNENFARELFELFTLGEGNYSEADVKEAARAMTGYALDRDGRLGFRPGQHDNGRKTVLGQTGRFRMEDILSIVFKQEAAARFLPREFCRFYLSDEELPPDQLEALASLWRESGYSIPLLCQTVFCSQLFYETRFRGSQIKSPDHFYLGLLQDLELDVLPLARASLRMGRLMGQPFFNPPNVRGWVGGRSWINAATLAARRQVVETAINGIPPKRLNADEIRALEAAQTNGPAKYSVDLSDIRRSLGASDPAPTALAERLYSDSNATILERVIERPERSAAELDDRELRLLLSAALTAPSYQLC